MFSSLLSRIKEVNGLLSLLNWLILTADGEMNCFSLRRIEYTLSSDLSCMLWLRFPSQNFFQKSFLCCFLCTGCEAPLFINKVLPFSKILMYYESCQGITCFDKFDHSDNVPI